MTAECDRSLEKDVDVRSDSIVRLSMPAAWLVRGGSDGEFEDSALREGLVIAGWECGDLTSAAGKQDIRRELVRAYPDESKATIGNWTGQLWRLVGEIKDQDFVVPGKSQSARSSDPTGFVPTHRLASSMCDLCIGCVRSFLVLQYGRTYWTAWDRC